jgi:NACalpha-BTF3-like transcription factor
MNSPSVPVVRQGAVQEPPNRSLRITNIFGRQSSKKESDSSGKKTKCKESDVKKIMEMGFTRDQAVTALLQQDHNLIMAINSLTG